VSIFWCGQKVRTGDTSTCQRLLENSLSEGLCYRSPNTLTPEYNTASLRSPILLYFCSQFIQTPVFSQQISARNPYPGRNALGSPSKPKCDIQHHGLWECHRQLQHRINYIRTRREAAGSRVVISPSISGKTPCCS